MDKKHRLRTRSSFAGALAIFLAIAVHAAPFDEKSKAPRAASSQALRANLEAHFQTYERKQQEADPAAFIRDERAHRQWSDLYFAVKLALDERVPLGDLAEFGLVAQADGSHVVDLRKFPQWDPLDERLYLLNNPRVFEDYAPALRARGFRDEDLSTLRAYLANHDPRLAVYAEARQLVDTFASQLQARRKAGQPPNLEAVLDYRYQNARLKAELQRRWAVGLLDTLDRQRQRILVALLDEREATLTFGRPTEPLNRTLELTAAPILSGEYAQALSSEEEQLRREAAGRAAKFMEGDQR